MADMVFQSPDYIIINGENDVEGGENNKGRSSNEVGLYIDTLPMPPMAERTFQSYETKRMGEVTTYATDYYNDITLNLTGYVFNGGAEPQEIYEFLNSAKTIRTSSSSTYYYRVKQLKGIIPAHGVAGKYRLDIQYICSPFRYALDNKAITVNGTDTIINNGSIFCRPVWELTMNATEARIKIGNDESNGFAITRNATMGDQSKTIVIDTEKMIVYDKKTLDNLLPLTTGELPILNVGYNSVTITGAENATIVKNERWI